MTSKGQQLAEKAQETARVLETYVTLLLEDSAPLCNHKSLQKTTGAKSTFSYMCATFQHNLALLSAGFDVPMRGAGQKGFVASRLEWKREANTQEHTDF